MDDYYQVLGIRRNASNHEIEMAYRGRRSQYHPDRYQGSDTETIAWATDQMQRLTTAYGALSNRDKRAALDSVLARGHMAPAEALGQKDEQVPGDNSAAWPSQSYKQQSGRLNPGAVEEPWTDLNACRRLHQYAIACLKEADAALGAMEDGAGMQLLDRELGKQFLNAAAKGLVEPLKAKRAYQFLEHVALLSRAICEVADGDMPTLPEELYRHRLTEPVFLNDLRATLRNLLRLR